MKARRACKKIREGKTRKKMKARKKQRQEGTQAPKARKHIKYVGT